MTAEALRLGRPLVALSLAATVLVTYIAFVFSHRWVPLEPHIGTRDGVVLPAGFLVAYGLELLGRVALSAVGFHAILWVTKTQHHSRWFLAASAVVCVLSAYAFLSVFRQEFMAEYVFRRPQDNTGYLFMPSIHSATIIFTLSVYLVSCLLVLPLTRTGRTSG